MFSFLTSMHNFNWRHAYGSSFYVPCIAVTLYLIVIYTIQWWVKTRRNGRPFDVQLAFAYHNLFLSFLSLLMFLLGAYAFLTRFYEESNDVGFAFCEYKDSHAKTVTTQRYLSHHSTSGLYYFASYIYYLSKYYELLDTVFLALKGKLSGWGGLNVYHHFFVVFMSYGWLETGQSLQHIGLLFNTFVHIIMYYYFYLSGIGTQPKWKKYVTKIQIIQFVTSFVCFLPNLYLNAASEGCRGQWALYMNSLFNATLLLEFVTIFKSTSSGERKSKRLEEKEKLTKNPLVQDYDGSEETSKKMM